MPTADHNTPQRAFSRKILVGSPGDCKKNNFEALSCGHFNFKNSAPECTRTRHFHSKKITGEGKTPPTPTHPLGAYGASTPAPLQNRRYATGPVN